MWETDWASRHNAHEGNPTVRHASRIDPELIREVYLLHWQEHCLECAVPDCYQMCPLYVARADQKCARLRYGILPNTTYAGPFGYGADVWFRRWGKLESRLWFGPVTPIVARRVAAAERVIAHGIVNPIARLFSRVSPERRLNRGYNLARDFVLRRLSRRPRRASEFDTFLIEAWNPADTPFNLIIECFQYARHGTRGDVMFRRSVRLEPGQNLHRIPVSSMHIDFSTTDGKILVYPENDAEVRVIFTWLDFVRMKSPLRKVAAPAATVKCVVWDLDNTLWDGILIEDGPDGITPRTDALEMVRRLDERGILQSIASKNDHDLAWGALTKLGVQEYFLYPAINWGPKSANIPQIAQALNIDPNTFAFIDDSPFERGEVESRLPQVRCYDAADVPLVLDRPEFAVPVTEDSTRRRATYQAEAKRKKIAETFGAEYGEFLKSCEMKATVFRPETPEHIARCLELLQRSNQLNLTTHRYEREEFLTCLDNPELLCLATRCGDRFGEYGTVGFASLRLLPEVPQLVDFVLSCRVAQKRVEHAWFYWLQDLLRARGYDRVQATFVPTDRNGVLWTVLEDVGFTEVARGSDGRLLELALDTPPPSSDIVTIIPPTRSTKAAG